MASAHALRLLLGYCTRVAALLQREPKGVLRVCCVLCECRVLPLCVLRAAAAFRLLPLLPSAFHHQQVTFFPSAPKCSSRNDSGSLGTRGGA